MALNQGYVDSVQNSDVAWFERQASARIEDLGKAEGEMRLPLGRAALVPFAAI